MGGSAFSALLPSTAFPRLPPPVYKALKARLLPKITELYTWVGVPIEAPEKVDHGDLDFLVAVPKSPHTTTTIAHEVVKEAISAQFVVPMEGYRTSNYAVPVRLGDWGAFGHADDELQRRSAAEDSQIFYQVDVHVCEDKNEWDRTQFFHSYGDLGMILGVIARNSGFHLGVKGLKVPDIPNPPFDLSDDFAQISEFLGLSIAEFHEGFQTKRDVFKWAASCKYFDPTQFRSSGPGITKVKAERTMYAEFIEWVDETRLEAERAQSQTSATVKPSREERYARNREEALIFFNKKDIFDAQVKSRHNKQKLKESFSGSRVRDWTELGEYWKGVKLIIDEVRLRLGGDDGVVDFLDANGEDELRGLVLQVKSDLRIVSKVPPKEDGEVAPLHDATVMTGMVKDIGLTERVSKRTPGSS